MNSKQIKEQSDFSIIFDEVEKYNCRDPKYRENVISEESFQENESIKAFGEICNEIGSHDNTPFIYATFA
jgi:hypothetical protein